MWFDKELIASRLIVFFKQNYANIEAVKYLFSELLPVEQRSVKLAMSAAIPFPFYLSQNLSDQMRDEFFVHIDQRIGSLNGNGMVYECNY